VWLVHQVRRNHVPLAAHDRGQPAPAVQSRRLVERAVLLVPEPLAREGLGRETVAREHHDNVALGRRVDHR